MEALKALDKVYHKGCFRCKQCDSVIGLKGFAAIEGEPYCKPHYLEIFKSKGNYSSFSTVGTGSGSSSPKSSSFDTRGFSGIK